jgi:3-dehydroquinate dehydratase-2
VAGACSILVLSGPNLNLLGSREPSIYGRETLADIHARLGRLAGELGASVDCRQHNGEGDLIDALHGAAGRFDGVVFNPGAYAHTSYALRDAIAAIGVPVVEVHLSNVFAREPFRHTSVIAPVVWGTLSGLGSMGYELALRALVMRARESATA